MAAVNVIAIMKVREDKSTWALENVFKTLVEKSRQEPGVISYDLFNDVKEPGTFVFNEKYKNQEALKAHSKSAHFLEVIGKITEFLTDAPQIRVIKPLL